MSTESTMKPQATTTIAAFVTLGGALVRVTRSTWFRWECEGCESSAGSYHYGLSAKRDANEHASECRAVSVRARVFGQGELSELCARMTELTETVADLAALTGRTVDLAAREDVRQELASRGRRRRRWMRGGR